MVYKITLNPAFSDVTADSQLGGFRLRVVATDPVGLVDAAIFAYLAAPPAPGATDRVGVFDHVCTPTDLAEFPVDQPDDAVAPGWFRSAVVDLVFRARGDALLTYDDVEARVGLLLEALAAGDRLTAATAVTLAAGA